MVFGLGFGAGTGANTGAALVWLLLLAFGLAGSMLPIATYRATAGTRWFKRVPILSLGVLAMLAVWLLGLWLFFNLFVMTCANFERSRERDCRARLRAGRTPAA